VWEEFVSKIGRTLVCLTLAVSACSKSPTRPSDVVTPAPACVYSVSSTTFNIAGSGGTATFAVNTGGSCAWTAASNSAFVTITSGTSQTGSGTVSFSVAENPGDARSGSLTVAGQNVVINQSPNDQIYGNWGGTVTKGNGCPATLPSSVEWTGTLRRTGGATNEFLISIPSAGVINQVLPVTINGSSLQFFVPIDTLYTFNATISSDRRSLTGTFSGGTCSGTWAGTRR
jgi:Putative binding domain, N-terminal